MEAAAISVGHAHDDHHHGPPEANRSSRVEPQLLGMMLFIISEIMVFGAFFTAYFFIRVVSGDQWFPVRGHELPVYVALVNTCILVSSSFTLHWAEVSIKKGNRFGLKAGMLTTFLLGCTFLFVQINEYVHIGFSPQNFAQGSIFYGLTGLHGAHVFIGLTLLAMVVVRSFRGHFTEEQHRGVEVPGIYWHFVDIMWIVVYLTVYVL
jgi:cytochrome c oxidase subunit III